MPFIPLWVWRMRHPSFFRKDEYGDIFLKEEVISPDLLSYIPIGLSLQQARCSAKERLKKTADQFEWATSWLVHGKEFDSSKPEDSLLLVEDELLGEMGHCFLNSLGFGLGLIESNETALEVRYVEGLAIGANDAFVHAWLTVNGRVLDPTWGDSFMCSYYGIEFEIPWVDELFRKHNRIGLLFNWEAVREEVENHIQARKDSP